MSKPKFPVGTPAPPIYKCRYDFEWFRKFTWRERLAILLGSNFRLQASFLTSSSMGKVQPVFVGGVTIHKTPEAQAGASEREKLESEKLTPPLEVERLKMP